MKKTMKSIVMQICYFVEDNKTNEIHCYANMEKTPMKSIVMQMLFCWGKWEKPNEIHCHADVLLC